MATAFKQISNNAASTTATVFTSTGVTSTVVATGDGAKFPTPGNGFYATIWTGSTTSDPGSDANVEIVTVTAKTTDTFTHSATTKTHASPVNFALLDVAANITDIQTAVNAIETAPYLTPSSTNTLTNKTLTAPKVGSILDTNGNTIIGLSPTASAVNYVNIRDSATGLAPVIQVAGTDTNIEMYIEGKGNAGVMLADGNAAGILETVPGTTPVNYTQILSSPTTAGPIVKAVGSDTNIDLNLTPKGTGNVRVQADPTISLGVATKQYVDNQATSSSNVNNEVPAGTINSSNTAFTTASNMATGSLRVYRNGVRMKGGGVDFTQGSNNAFTMVTAPLTGDTLLVDYNVSASGFSVGTNSNITNQAPTGSVNSSNTSYTVAQGKYIAGSLEVYIDGIHQARGVDYTETTPASGIFTMTTAPVTGQSIYCNYQFNLNPSSNADTVDGIHASATGGVVGQLVADDGGGWLLMAPTLTYASATTITTSADMSGYLSVGDKLRIVQTTTKYFYIVGITSTTLTVTGGSDYSVANASITSPYYSKQATPFGFPLWFNWTPTFAGWSVTPSLSLSKFSINGRAVTVELVTTNTTSNATTTTLTLPVAAAANSAYSWVGHGVDNSSDTLATYVLASSSATVTAFKVTGVGTPFAAWTASGTKGVRLSGFNYEI